MNKDNLLGEGFFDKLFKLLKINNNNERDVSPEKTLSGFPATTKAFSLIKGEIWQTEKNLQIKSY